MPANLPEDDSQVLEDGVDGLHPEPELAEGEELAKLNEIEPEQPAAAAAPAKPQPAAAAAADDDAELPQELRGKSKAEIARMYREAQSLIGRQGTELGDFRKKADLLIQASLANLHRAQAAPAAAPAKPEVKPLDDSEFFANPQQAIARAIAEHPALKEIRETLGHAAEQQEIDRATRATERFYQAHPDAGTILNDPEFKQWAEASPVRMELLNRAHDNYDFAAADEIFGTWKALKGIRPGAPAARPAPAAPAPDAAAARVAAQTLAARRKAAANAGAMPSGGNASPAQAGGGAKKIYRRADVLDLMENNPERYAQLAPEIEAAYRENRVR